MTAPSEQRGGRVVGAEERAEAEYRMIASSVAEQWSGSLPGQEPREYEVWVLARSLLAAEQENAALREALEAYGRFDDVIAALSDARREDYRYLQCIKLALTSSRDASEAGSE